MPLVEPEALDVDGVRVTLQRRGEDRERQVLLVFGGPAREGLEAAALAARERLVDQRGLADPGLAADDDDRALARFDAAQQILDHADLRSRGRRAAVAGRLGSRVG